MNRVLERVSLLVALVLIIGFAGAQAETVSAGNEKTFAWQRTSTFFYDSARFEGEPVQELLENAMVDALTARGLRLVESTDAADLHLSYVVVLKNASTESEIAEFRDKHPGIAALNDGPQKFEGGVLYAKLVDRQNGTKVWENRYQGLVALDMPQAQREIRTNEIIEEFLSTYSP